jgi:aspartate carbamoyltransferase regulatory subunit
MDVEVYIGDLNDPDFKWEGGDWSGNAPSRISEFFPSPSKLFDSIIIQINNNQINGKQVDWGCWVAPLYPNEILVIIENYEMDRKTANQARSIKRFVTNLNSNQKYALVACEIS